MTKSSKSEREWWQSAYLAECASEAVEPWQDLAEVCFQFSRNPRRAAKITRAARASYPSAAARDVLRLVERDWEKAERQARREQAQETEYTAKLARLNAKRDVRDLAEANAAGV